MLSPHVSVGVKSPRTPLNKNENFFINLKCHEFFYYLSQNILLNKFPELIKISENKVCTRLCLHPCTRLGVMYTNFTSFLYKGVLMYS